MKFKILLQHQDFVLINKPSGLLVHQDDDGDSMLVMLASQLGVARVWLVHRLDKPTSGVLLLALNQQAASLLAQQFANKCIKKHILP